MKIYLAFIVLLLSQISFAQTNTKHRLATEKEQEIHDRSEDCAKRGSLSFTQRLKNYPFNKASQIQLVSFKRHNDTLESGVIIGNKTYSLPRKNDSICYSRLFEVKNLTYVQVDKLTDILYNYGYRQQLKNTGLTYIETVAQCYNPRNAILFLDAKGRVFEFVEICFECDRMEESSKKINLGVMCNQKLELLKGFFKQVGLEYGITKIDD